MAIYKFMDNDLTRLIDADMATLMKNGRSSATAKAREDKMLDFSMGLITDVAMDIPEATYATFLGVPPVGSGYTTAKGWVEGYTARDPAVKHDGKYTQLFYTAGFEGVAFTHRIALLINVDRATNLGFGMLGPSGIYGTAAVVEGCSQTYSVYNSFPIYPFIIS